MIHIVDWFSNEILASYDAGSEHAYHNAIAKANEKGYEYLAEKITSAGDMIITVKLARF